MSVIKNKHKRFAKRALKLFLDEYVKDSNIYNLKSKFPTAWQKDDKVLANLERLKNFELISYHVGIFTNVIDDKFIEYEVNIIYNIKFETNHKIIKLLIEPEIVDDLLFFGVNPIGFLKLLNDGKKETTGK